MAEETVHIKKERLEEAQEEYEEEHRTFTTFSQRLEEKWEQRFDTLATRAREAGIASEDIQAIRQQPRQPPEAVTAEEVAAAPPIAAAAAAAPPPAAPAAAAALVAATAPVAAAAPPPPAAPLPAAAQAAAIAEGDWGNDVLNPGDDEEDENDPNAMDGWGIQTRGERFDDLKKCRCIGCNRKHPGRKRFELRDIDGYDEHGEPDSWGWRLRATELTEGACPKCQDRKGADWWLGQGF